MSHENGNWMNDDQRASCADLVNLPITEDWLKDIGFKWSQGPAPGLKHWLLWLGQAVGEPSRAVSSEDLGVELAFCDQEKGTWFCWLRADYCGRYTRLIHVRHIKTRGDLTGLIAGLTGFPYDKENACYGGYHRPEDRARLREYDRRFEVRLAKEWGGRVERETGADPSKDERLHP